ncbi:MAG: aminotransferase class I/II-fold pyridoxal phosphate-dependent enzyme [Deltaproteobacteria bacterium]|nr:aminotransferase class I/II-fold pyridoxal phosphate-dependent enzyme [Deltaproteobacteria bacterium]MCZ6714597.1 aminotransferase class I/II-fold pyridoxal phosphate-dependent enzyme [Deltaproteobacteria bacterium]
MNVSVHKYIVGSTAVEISDSIESALREGRLASGDRLPTVRALSRERRVSPATVASAYRSLRERGLLVAQGRRGTRISARPPLYTRARAPVPQSAVNLAAGNPDPALLPRLTPALQRLDPPPRLYTEELMLPKLLRLSRRGFERDGIPVDTLAVVGGALDGIERVLGSHLRRGDRVAVEDPAFSGVLDLLSGLGLVAEPVAIDDSGPLPAALETTLRLGVQALVVTPRAQNPTGAALEPARVRALRRVLRAFPEVLIIEDDHAGPVAGAPAYTLCDAGRARWAVVRSASKSLGPDLRLAVLSGDAVTVARVEGRQLLGIRWVSHLLQRLVVELWTERGMANHLKRAERIYTQRREALLAALGKHGIEARGRSGLNVWVPVPEEANIVSYLLECGWAVVAGERYRIETPPAIRITTATLEPSHARRLAADLARALAPSRRSSEV